MQITLRPTPGTSPMQLTAQGGSWVQGRLLSAQVVSVREGQIHLLIAGQEHQAVWPGQTAPASGSTLVLKVVGYAQGQWLLELVKEDLNAPFVSVLQVLEQAGLPVTYRNLLSLRRPAALDSRLAHADEQDEALCPWDQSLLRQVTGWDGMLLPAMLTVNPFPLGLFDVKQRDASPDAPTRKAWLLAVRLDALGQVEVIGQGEWPTQSLTFLAKEETLRILKKREGEIVSLLRASGMVLEQVSYLPTSGAMVNLLEQALLTTTGCDILL